MKASEGRQEEMKANSEAWDQDTDNAEGLLFVAGGEAVTSGAAAGPVAAVAGDSGTGAGVGVQRDSTKTETGVSRAKDGKLLPGTRSLNPAGRKSRQYEKDMVNAIKDVLTPDNIRHYLTTALNLAVSQQSARGIVAVLTLGMAYGAGKPVQQIVADSGKTELLEQLLQGDNGEPLLPDVHEVTSAHE